MSQFVYVVYNIDNDDIYVMKDWDQAQALREAMAERGTDPDNLTISEEPVLGADFVEDVRLGEED